MVLPARVTVPDNPDKPAPLTPTREMLAHLGVSPQQFERRQEQMRKAFSSASPSPFLTYPSSSLPFPLNLPPSYSIYSTTPASAQATRLQRPAPFPYGASFSPSPVSNVSGAVNGDSARALGPQGASSAKAKGKLRSLDAFMESRQSSQLQESESSSSDSDLSLEKMLSVPKVNEAKNGESSAPLSSPPSSSPLHTPRETSPMPPSEQYPSSPTLRPKRSVTTRTDASDLPYTLPPGPYLEEKPSWSLAALIGQAINASFARALPLNDIYNYVSTVYPHFDRRDQAWMSSVRHSLSVNEAFERVADQEGTVVKKGRGKGKGKLKGGLWRIKPGYEDCFVGGNFVRKGAKGAGPGMNSGTRKRVRGDEGEQAKEKKSKPSLPGHSRANSQVVASPSSQTQIIHSCSFSSPSPGPSNRPPQYPISSPPPLSASQSTLPSDSSPTGTSVNLPGISLVITPEKHPSYRLGADHSDPGLAPGFEFQSSPNIQNPSDRLFRVSHAYPTSSITKLAGDSEPHKQPQFILSSPRTSTPPPSQTLALSPERTPISHRGLQMSPSRSLAHYKNSLEPEWKVAGRPTTPTPGCSLLRPPSRNSTLFATPKQSIFPSSKPYDPCDPTTMLAEEIATLRRNDPNESPGGFFGKEGRKLLYDSPSDPGKSNWRFGDFL